jgi:hypothetical protein
MKKLIGLLGVSIVSISSLNAQDNYGYYGKKNYLDISSSSYIPLIYNLSSNSTGYDLYSSTTSTLTESKTWFNVGLRASLGRALTSKIGVALDFGFDRYRIYRNLFNTGFDKTENVRVNSIIIMPRLEFSGPNGLLPNGLVHQVGIGFSLNKAVTRNYVRQYDGSSPLGGPNADPAEAEQLMIFEGLDYTVKMMQLMYSLKMRTPIGKSLMLNYGFRYTLDFGGVTTGLASKYPNYAFARDVHQYLFRNLIAFDLGLTLPF